MWISNSETSSIWNSFETLRESAEEQNAFNLKGIFVCF